MSEQRDSHAPVEESDRWVLPLEDGIVTQLQVDVAFGFTVESWLHFRIETPFRIEDKGSDAEYEPEDSPSLSPLLDLYQAVVAAATVFKDGRLRVEFQDGRTLTVQPDPQYEAFTISSWRGANGFKLIALPGGGLAEFL